MFTSVIVLTFSILPFLASSAPPLSRRQSPSLTVKTEDGLTWCRPYADNMDDLLASFYEPTSINITCWTTTTMPDEKGIVQGSKLWLWAANVTNEGGKPVKGVGTPKTTEHGCWINEMYIQAGKLDLKKELKSCGDAPQHQVFYAKNGLGFTCHACTNLDKPECQRTWNGTGGLTPLNPGEPYPGYLSAGCWKSGTKVNGNGTWVRLRDEDCYVSPDQPNPKEWHGNPAPKCSS
ncbi:hypothetical protein BCR34DRAFT_593668 [Clohesyomyces aquaticus]|uniref:Secreted protein n=1 Tax=Clohesyomyces aquaticus TaxID=1231657 RepID=A0A1Y1YG44_9PLEO|nr:hypothetical protein BCR34DRAFT_593668 [Clohesyomyces aquaticus]